jgi:hypothetical protein
LGLRDEVTGEWRRLHNEGLHVPYSSLNILVIKMKKNEIGVTYSTYGSEERCIQDFGGKTLEKKTT